MAGWRNLGHIKLEIFLSVIRSRRHSVLYVIRPLKRLCREIKKLTRATILFETVEALKVKAAVSSFSLLYEAERENKHHVNPYKTNKPNPKSSSKTE